MNCPVCHHGESHVYRTGPRGSQIRRHRRCAKCGHPWITVEMPEAAVGKAQQVIDKARELAALLPQG